MRVLSLTAALFLAHASSGGNATSGLETRPINLTCVAPERPLEATGMHVERAFPNLSFQTIPDSPSSNFLNGAIHMAQIPGDNSVWYIVERGGIVYRVPNDDATTTREPVLDISAEFAGITYYSQWGINSIAFHPDFADNGQLYMVYNDRGGSGPSFESVLARYTSFDGGLSFDPATEEILISMTNNKPNHRFDHIAFGPDGYLYAAHGSPQREDGQNKNNLYGTMMRLDVDGPFPYAIPADNPFVGVSGDDEIFAYGLRNPWRFSFDSVTGEIWAGDVGENQFEEVNRIIAGGNFGWDISEGNNCSGAGCSGVTLPELAYPHSDGISITGGYVYRGSAIPELYGRYLFGDAATGNTIWGLTYDTEGNVTGKEDLVAGQPSTGFAEDQNGEIMILNLIADEIYRLLPGTTRNTRASFPQTLSASGCFDPADPRTPAPGLIPYEVNAPLWADGASKRQWMAVPDGAVVEIDASGDFVFPPGTVLAKEFSFNGVPFETRLFMRHPDGVWAGYSYEWADDLSDATLLDDAKTKIVNGNVSWTYPSPQQCLQCHTDALGFAAGPEIAQLNRSATYPSTGYTANQLATFEHIGLLDGGLPAPFAELPALTALGDGSAPVTRRARSYLHSNCSGCHRPGGTTQSTLDLRFDTPIAELDACNVVPSFGNLGVSGARLIFPGSPPLSVLSLRLHAQDANRMPPLGTSLLNAQGNALIDAWLAGADVCMSFADSDADGVADNIDNCTLAANPLQRDSDGDGIGNSCDADLNQDCMVNVVDLGLLKNAFFAVGESAADMNADDLVNAVDLGKLRARFFGTPGPSGLATACGP